MDLSGFGGYRPDGQGGRPYSPVMMTTLLLYCYCRGRKSAREIEMATFDDVGARVICGGLHPDHSTVARFVRRNVAAVLGLLPESVRACAAEGLVDLSVVAGDGTKLKASASMAGNLTREQLDAQVAELQALIDGQFRAWVQDILDDGGGAAAPGAAPVTAPGRSGSGSGSRPARSRCSRGGWRPAPGWTPGRARSRTRRRAGTMPGSRNWPPGCSARRPPWPGGKARPGPGPALTPPGSPPAFRPAAGPAARQR